MAESVDDSQALLLKARLEEKKALDVVVINLYGRSTVADFFLVATGTSRTHVASLADEVDLFCHEQGIPVLGMAGKPESTWVLVDAGDLVVHLFQRETREFYDLEKLWSPQSRPNVATTVAEALVS